MSTLYVDNLQPNLGSQVEIPDLKMPSGSVVRMGHAKHSTYVTSAVASTWVEAYQFSIADITTGNTIYMMYSVNDLVEAAIHVTFRIQNTATNGNIMQWSRTTAANGSWRGIIADATGYDSDTSGGTRTYSLQFAGDIASSRYINYPASYTDAASFLTWWEIAQ